MHRIDSANRVVDKFGSGKDGFTEGTPGVTPPTETTDDWFDGVQEEICNVVEGAGRVLAKGTRNQLLESIAALVSKSAALNFTESGNPPAGMASVYDVAGNDRGMVIIANNGIDLHYTNIGNADLYWKDDGANWQGSIQGIDWFETPGMFVAVTSTTNGIQRVVVGPGTNTGPLTIVTATYSGGAPSTQMRDIRWDEANGIGVAVGGSTGTEQIYSSTDGITWTKRTSPANGSELRKVRFGNGAWIAVGVDNSGNERVIRSTDGISWTDVTHAAPAFNTMDGVAYDPVNDVWMTISSIPAGSGQRCWTSIDGGLTWVSKIANTPTNVEIEPRYDGGLNPPDTWDSITYDQDLGGFVIGDYWGLLLTVNGDSFSRLLKLNEQAAGTDRIDFIRRCYNVALGQTQVFLGRGGANVLHSDVGLVG